MTEKKVLIVIAPQNFRDEELTQPIHHLEDAGILFEIISTARGLAVGMLGGKMLIDKTVADLATGDSTGYAAICLVGGSGAPDYLWNNPHLINLVRTFNERGAIMSAICLAPVVLAQAGVLKDKRATVWNDDQAIAEIRAGGGTFTSEPVVVDGRIITANGPNASDAFGEKLAKAVLSS